MKNRLTSHEKQMPYLRLPLRMAVLSSIDLFIAIIFTAVWYLNGNTPGAIAIGVALGCPALVALILYTNHLIAFDKDRFVYRSFSRKLYRYTFQDILKIEEDGNKIYIYTSDQKIRINDNSRNGIWFMELAGRKKQEGTNLTAEEEQNKRDAFQKSIFMAIAALLFIGVYLWIFLTAPSTRLLRNSFLIWAVLGIYGSLSAGKCYKNYADGTYEHGAPKGIYLLDKQGRPVTGINSPRAILGFLFIGLGLILNVIYPLFYAAAAFCFISLLWSQWKLHQLHKKPKSTINKVLKKYYPSKELEQKLVEAKISIPSHEIKYKPINMFEERFVNIASYWIPERKILIWAPAALTIFFLIFLFCNMYIHDARFEKTTEIDMSFYSGEYDYVSDSSPLGNDYILIPTDDTLAENYVYIQGFDRYGQHQELLENNLDGKTIFHTISVFQDAEKLEILQITSTDGTVLLSTNACKQRQRYFAIQQIKIVSKIALAAVIFGIMLSINDRIENRKEKKCGI